MGILNEFAPEKAARDPVAPTELDGARSTLDASALALVIEELKYDEKCLTVFLTKMESFQVRLSHQRTEWIQKRFERARSSVTKWMDSKASFANKYNQKSWYSKFNMLYTQFCSLWR